jgi:hypothetical protein
MRPVRKTIFVNRLTPGRQSWHIDVTLPRCCHRAINGCLPPPPARRTLRNTLAPLGAAALITTLLCPSLAVDCFAFDVGTLGDASSSYNTEAQGKFITALTSAPDGALWAATEDNGVSRYEPHTPSKGKLFGTWTQFTVANTAGGLGDDDCYALACDRLGRVWVGTLREGVSVYNGVTWRTFGPTEGPLGSHVVALATSPIDGDVWGATEAGLFRYSLAKKTWRYFTRAEGLPSDQINSLAFAANGNLFAGTDCDGIVVGSAAGDFKDWRTIPGATALPNTPSGSGLPGALVNAVLIARDDAIWVGTTCGLAVSRDHGASFTYTRGSDWKAKAAGLYHPVPTRETPVTGDLLSEDWVSCLDEMASGDIAVGHRRTGLEVLNARTGKRQPGPGKPFAPNTMVQALLPSGDGLLVGRYGESMATIPSARAVSVASHARLPVSASIPALPSPAGPPSAVELDALRLRVESRKTPLAPGTAAVYLGEDWVTQGDWVGRYGRQAAKLCAARSPLDHDLVRDTRFAIAHGEIGPHHQKNDAVRLWVHWEHTDIPKSLYDPIPGYRRQAEWDDHGEAYDQAFEGPDVWVSFQVPTGVHRVSLYFMNKDGHDGVNRLRDFPIELHAISRDIESAPDTPVLARARVRFFWGGVYKSFVVAGPAQYRVRISRNGGHNTIVSAVMLDKLIGDPHFSDAFAGPWMGYVQYNPPLLPPPGQADPHLLDRILAAGLDSVRRESATTQAQTLDAARALWTAVDTAQGSEGSAFDIAWARWAAYRAASGLGAEARLLENWRWALHFWTPADRTLFADTIKRAHEAQLNHYPQMRGLSF